MSKEESNFKIKKPFIRALSVISLGLQKRCQRVSSRSLQYPEKGVGSESRDPNHRSGAKIK